MPFAIIEEPPVFLARRVGVVSPEHVSAMLERLRLVLSEATSPCAAVYDAGPDPSGRPDARARQMFAAFFTEHGALLRKRCVAVHCAFPTALSRGVLTAIFWLKSPPIDVQVHASCEEAVRAAAQSTRSKADVRDLVRRLDGAAASLQPGAG